MKKKETVEIQLRKFAFDPSKDKIVQDLGFNKNHPYFEKKADQSVETLKKYGFPHELLKIQTIRSKK